MRNERATGIKRRSKQNKDKERREARNKSEGKGNWRERERQELPRLKVRTERNKVRKYRLKQMPQRELAQN